MRKSLFVAAIAATLVCFSSCTAHEVPDSTANSSESSHHVASTVALDDSSRDLSRVASTVARDDSSRDLSRVASTAATELYSDIN